MSAARTLIADNLRAGLGSAVRVIEYARDVDQPPDRPTVMIRVDEVTPSSAAARARTYAFAVIALPVRTSAGPGDDELDALVEDVIAVYEQGQDGCTWVNARRATFNNLFPCYEVNVTVTLTVTPPTP